MNNNDENKIINWGIIGAGDVCEKKSAPAMYKLPGSRVKSVMRRDGEKAADFAERHNIPHAYNDADRIFKDPEIDIVYISTPPSSHPELAIRSANAGKPAYVEKPMAADYKGCEAMNYAFREAGLPLFVAYYRRTLPNFLKIKELVDSGVIGEVRIVNIIMNKEAVPDNVRNLDYNWRVIPEVAGGGYFFDLASHQLDFLDFLFGPVKEAKGITANQGGLYEAEDVVTASFSFESGVVGSGSWCFTAGQSADIDKTTIVGSRGQIEYATFGDPTVHLISDEKGMEEFNFELPLHIQQNLVKSILDEFRGKGACPSTGITAARTSLAMEMIVRER